MAINLLGDGPGSSAMLAVDVLDISDALRGNYTYAYVTRTHLIVPTKGTLQARLTISLPGNAVVDALELRVTARRADEAQASDVAELRGTDIGAGVTEIVVDFGTVRTVAAVGFTVSCNIRQIDAWNGTQFPAFDTGRPYVNLVPLPAGNIPDNSFAVFTSERRTERLRIWVASTFGTAALLDALSLVLPDSPKDLSISLDGGPPVWTVPGPAAKGAGTGLTADAWNDQNQRLAVLTDAVRAITGNPLDDAVHSHELILTSREAGVLEIAEYRREIRYIRRARFGTATATTLDFGAEGVDILPLVAPGTPPGAIAAQVALGVSGKFGPERRIPPLGPDPAPGLDDPALPLVALDLNIERAVLVRLDPVAGLPALSGLRLPLVAGPDGAEVRLAPWSNLAPGRVQPAAPLAKLIGDPVAMEPGTLGWVGLNFGAPLVIDPADPPWVAVLVTRGSASVGLSATGQPVLRVGPPSGPWRTLPDLFATAGYATLGLPIRVIGAAQTRADPAPLAFGIGAAAPQAIDPVPTGSRMVLTGLSTPAPALVITHLAGGQIGLSDIDIIFDS